MRANWIADRALRFESSGIRRVFELAATMRDPVNLSIGQPDFDVPDEVKDACVAAIREGRNGYSLTQGIAPLRARLAEHVGRQYPGQERSILVTSGTSGALVLAFLAAVNPGDEVILFDPYFVMYRPLVEMVGGTAVLIDTFPDFQIDPERVKQAITPRTKVIVLNSPANPTGVVAGPDETRGLAELAARHGVLLISDEIYRDFHYDGPVASPATHNPDVLVIDGFSKSHGMTGWRLGFAHGPAEWIEAMMKLQQYTFVCAPQPVQWAGLAALDCDMSPRIKDYQQKRDRVVEGLRGYYELTKPGGAFYAFPRVPRGSDTEFIEAAVKENLLVIPGNIFSRHTTHFRISFAADDRVLDRGIEILRKLAR